MSVRKNVFGSEPERKNFKKLSRQWADRYTIYHNLPFLSVFDPSILFNFSDEKTLEPIQLTSDELGKLKKTSIDFTFCDNSDKPIVCIEFDGLQQGFNVGTTYHSDRGSNPWRKEITELKLKVAYGSMFPFFVVGSEYFKDFSEQTKLTIVDGIIGEILANEVARTKFSQGIDPSEFGYTEEEFARLPELEKSEMIQDWIVGVEVLAEMENNPVSRRSAELEREVNTISYSLEYLSTADTSQVSDLAESYRLHEEAKSYGARVTISTEDFGEVKATAWLPNFKAPGFSGIGLTEEIAKLIALEKLKKLRTSKRRY